MQYKPQFRVIAHANPLIIHYFRPFRYLDERLECIVITAACTKEPTLCLPCAYPMGIKRQELSAGLVWGSETFHTSKFSQRFVLQVLKKSKKLATSSTCLLPLLFFKQVQKYEHMYNYNNNNNDNNDYHIIFSKLNNQV